MKTEPRFKIGQKFKPIGRKYAQIRTIVDILKTYNSAGELVEIRYVSEHEFMGQKVIDRNVVDSTIARGLVE